MDMTARGPLADPACDTVTELEQDQDTLRASRPDEAALPFRVGDYLLEAKLGEGGIGRVFRARHAETGTKAAIKLIETAGPGLPFELPIAELKCLGSYDHPNLVRILEVDDTHRPNYLAMELVEGITLTEYVRRNGPLGCGEACRIIRQAASGLQQLHDAALVHRDVKPGNLMITREGEVKVIDLDLVLRRKSSFEDNLNEPAVRLRVGTRDYMAPEQHASSRRIDQRADVYSLGCTLHFLLTGQQFIQPGQDTPSAPSNSSLRQLRPSVSGELEWLCRKMTAPRPSDRLRSMGAVLAALPEPMAVEPSDALLETKSVHLPFVAAVPAGKKTPEAVS